MSCAEKPCFVSASKFWAMKSVNALEMRAGPGVCARQTDILEPVAYNANDLVRLIFMTLDICATEVGD